MIKKPISDANNETWSKVVWCEYFEHVIFQKGYLEHSHPNFEIAFFIKACTKEFIKDIVYEIRDGDMAFIDEYDLHRIIAASNDLGSGYVLHFKRVFIDRFLSAFHVEPILAKIFKQEMKVVSLNLRQREIMEMTMTSFLRTYERYAINPCDPMIHASLVAQLFSLLVAALKYLPPEGASMNVSRPEEMIQRIIVFIEEHYAEPWKLDDLACSFNLSKYYLSHIFKTHTGFTLFEYILHRRIIEAQKMLKNTNLSIVAICSRCGFANIQYFYKVFKKIVKTSPAAFRKTGKHITYTSA